MEKIYEILKKYKVNIRELCLLCNCGYISLLNYFKGDNIPFRPTIVAHIVKKAIKYCDNKIEKFNNLKKELSTLDNEEFYAKETDKINKKIEQRYREKIEKIRSKL